MIYPGATWVGGGAAGYAKGRNAMRACTLHYTVGIDSTGIGAQGYFNFLVAKDGTVEQFAEVDALTWHAGEANPTGPGIEFERLSDAEPLTAEQLAAGGALVAWLIGLGIPDTFHDGERIPPAAMSGFVTHRSIQQSQPHSDYVTAADWAAMRGGTQPEEDDDMGLLVSDSTGAWWILTKAGTRYRVFTGDVAWLSFLGFCQPAPPAEASDEMISRFRDVNASIGSGDCPDCPPGIDAATTRDLVAALAKKV